MHDQTTARHNIMHRTIAHRHRHITVLPGLAIAAEAELDLMPLAHTAMGAVADTLLRRVITDGDDHDAFPSAALACLTELERLFFFRFSVMA